MQNLISICFLLLLHPIINLAQPQTLHSLQQSFKVSYSRATKMENGDLRLNYTPTGQSTQTTSSDVPFWLKPVPGSAIGHTWQDELDQKLTTAVNDFFGKLALFDKNNLTAAQNVYTMNQGLPDAIKIPKQLQLYRKSLAKYKLLEPLAGEVQHYIQTTDKIYVLEMKKIADGYLNRQSEPFQNGNSNFNSGKYIEKFSGELPNLVRTTKTNWPSDVRFSPDQAGQIAKLRSDIATAQSQIKKIMGNKKDLDELTAAARSQVLQIAGIVALALKQTATLISTYLEAFAPLPKVVGSIDVIRSFLESAIEEHVVNLKPMSEAFHTAFQMAYVHAVLQVSSSREFPLAALSTLPLKIKGMVDDTKTWEMLLDEPSRLRAQVNSQFQQMDAAIRLNESIIKRSSDQIEKVISSESKKYLKAPYKD